MSSPRERNLKQKLLSMPEPDMFRLIFSHFHDEPFLGLRLAKARLRSPRYFLEILRYGLEKADASNIQYYLECCVPHLGRDRVMEEIESFGYCSAKQREAARYQMGAHPMEATA